MKLAMFGGSFDPVHNNHVSLCETMIKNFDLGKVIVVPAACSPFKDRTEADDNHRLIMCRLAFEKCDRAEVSDFEISRGGKSYTVDTLNHLKSLHTDAELYLITGADAFLTLSNWYKSEEIFRLSHILAVVRDNDDINALKAKADEYEKFGAKCSLLSFPVGSISSTAVRNAIKNGSDDLSSYLDNSVIEYIKENRLYGYGN